MGEHLHRGDFVVLQPANWRDFREIWALERACFLEDAWPRMDVLAALTFPGTVRWKAVLDGQAVGFVIGDRQRWRDLGWIASLGVHPDYRRRGIGRTLLDACEQALATTRLRLTLRVSNLAAFELYEQAGYQEVTIWQGYYRNGEDGLVMEKVLR
ncbi:MAG TPA: GNAT family N-acetyltransferase [Anaerolineales bacterium]|nr:GNAT family N-acetyltransferase [Anaerolineales bacterium]